MDFVDALSCGSLHDIERAPKSDLHSHAGRGGRLAYLERYANAHIAPPDRPFDSLDDMNRWLAEAVKPHCPGLSGYLKRVEAAFAQSDADAIAVLAMSFDIAEIDLFGSMDAFTAIVDDLHAHFAPHARFCPDLAIGYVRDSLDRIEEVLAAGWFTGIDICNYAGLYAMDELERIRALAGPLIAKAHIGEFGGADDVLRYADALQLDQIQHGIAAARSAHVMRWLADHRVQLNVCPTSNIMLRNASDYATHPIRALFDAGIPVTLNTDDLLIFQATASQEYANLYRTGCWRAEELDAIRLTGLAYPGR